MADPADHTLRLLREIRSDIKERDEGLNRKIDSLNSKVDRGFAELKESMDSLAQALAGEMVTDVTPTPKSTNG